MTAEPVWATRSSPSFDASAMDGIAVRAADTIGASESTPVFIEPDAYVVLDTGDPLPERLRRRGHARARPLRRRGPRRAALGGRAVPARALDRRGRQRRQSCCCPTGHRLRAVDVAAAAAAGAIEVVVHRAPGRRRAARRATRSGPSAPSPAPGVILDTNSLMLVAQAEAAGCTAWRSPIIRDDPNALTDAVRDAATRADLVIVVAGSSAGPRRPHGERGRACGCARRPRRGGPAGPPRRPGQSSTERRCWAPRATPCRRR